MAYFFDLKNTSLSDYNNICNDLSDLIIKSVTLDNTKNQDDYRQQYGSLDGYKPRQNTVYLNNDGTISVFVNVNNTKSPLEIGGYCCSNKMGYVLDTANKTLGMFAGVDVTKIYWDANKQVCRWKEEPEYCALDSFKVVLNPVDNDGALFNVDNDDKQCSLTIDFDYLFKMDCQNLANILNPANNTNTDPVLLADIKALQNKIEINKTKCEDINSQIEIKYQEFSVIQHSIQECLTNKIYCINEANNGLTQWQNILGATNYKRFLDGNQTYTCDNVKAIIDLNTQLVNNNQQPIIKECTTPLGAKSALKAEIDKLTLEQTRCNDEINKLEEDLNALLVKLDIPSTCTSPIEALESLNVSVILDVVESDNSLTSVFEYDLFPTIGTGNLYNYLKNHPNNSGFYLCGEPNANETWTTGCTKFKNVESTNKTNVESCRIVKESLIKDLFSESQLANNTSNLGLFKNSLSEDILASKWLNYSTTIDDETILSSIKNKKIKISLKINNTCANVCIYIDNIKLIKDCLDGNGKSVLISESPGFELERIIDNKKSWIKNLAPVSREFNISNNSGLNTIRKTEYDVNDDRLIINSKEIDLDINIASAIENDVQAYINDNLNILDSVPKNDCGCSDLLPCYEDVFNIIKYSDAVDSGLISPQIDPHDLLTIVRSVRDAWLKAWEEYMLATPPYLDIINGVYHPSPSEDVMLTYRATKSAWLEALNEFNIASGSGYIEGLTVDKEFTNAESNDYVKNNFTNNEKLAPQMFNTKCGRIFKMNFEEGYLYFVETESKELKLYWAYGDFAPRNTTWLDMTSLVQEDYPANFDQTSCTPERAPFFCKFITGNNYVPWAQMMSYHYKNNNNASHNQWINPVQDSFFIDWDSVKGKCMINMFNQVVPEQFSMHYPIISKNFWTNYVTSLPIPTISPECTVDIYLRNNNVTACPLTIDWSWPNTAQDISTIYRNYYQTNFDLANETKLTENTPQYKLYILDPTTNMLPDESGGVIPVKITTTVTKGSRDGDVVFKEEYIKSGLTNLNIYIGITDPNSAYKDTNACSWTLTCTDCTLISGDTSMLPIPGASINGVDRNWEFDINYYVHFDVVNNITNEVYHVTNNDFNLKDRPMPIVCPYSASTQLFNINTALNSINSFKTMILGEIQEDLDNALSQCSCDDMSSYTDLRMLDFMDDLRVMPSFENMIAIPYSSGTVNFTSNETLYDKTYERITLGYHSYYTNEINTLLDNEHYVMTGLTLGFRKEQLTPLDYTNVDDANFKPNLLGNFYKGPIKKIKNLWWRKASTYPEWTGSTYPLHGQTLSGILNSVDDFTYLPAVDDISQLPSIGKAGELICVGTPSSYVGYAWNPILDDWKTEFYDFINTEILTQRIAQRDEKVKAKRELMLAMKPFIWANEYMLTHAPKQWLIGDAKNFDPSTTIGADIIYNYNNNISPLGLPPSYTMTAATYSLPSYTGNSNYIIY